MNSGAGLLFTPILGATFFIRGAYAWRKWGISPVIPIAAAVIAAGLCVLYVLGLCIRTQMTPEFVSIWAKIGNILPCAALGLGLHGWRTGLPLGVLVLIFNLITLGILAHLWKKSEIFGIVLFSGIMVLGACWVLPVSLGFARFADTRYITLVSGIIFVPLLFWALIEKQSLRLKKIGIFFQLSLLLFILVSNSFSEAIHFEKQKSSGAVNMLGQVQAGTPLEIIASRCAPQIIPWNSPKYSEDILKRLKGTSFLNMKILKEWSDVYSSDYTLLPLKNVLCLNMKKSKNNANAYTGDSSDSFLKIWLPRKEYVRAIYLEFNLTGNPQFHNSQFSVNWIGGNLRFSEQSCLMNGYNNTAALNEHLWIWVDSDIQEFYVQPRKNSMGETFLLEVKSIRLYQK